MKTAVVLSSLVAVCLAAPSGPAFYGAGPGFAPYIPYAHAPVVAPAVPTQYHSQDELGQYTYGYTEPLSSKAETKTFDGITRGGYSYLDSNGLVQTSQYVSDPVNGFRVAATNLPVAPLKAGVLDTPEVAEAKVAHFAALHKAEVRCIGHTPI